ncbi:MAG: PepSY-associated TM helix domain-containing protein [Verrucomicrobiota bacterium]
MSKPASTGLAAFLRWLHLYLSLFSFAALFFFAVTGVTLNHADWFYGDKQQTVQCKGQLNVRWVKPAESSNVARLEIVEFLRRTHSVKGALSDFRVEDSQCTVSFKGPGYAADTFINRDTGTYELNETRMGFTAIINDLHKGRDTGRVWSWMIDVSAILMCLVSLTGLVLVVFLKRRRAAGLAVAVVGTIICYLLYAWWVP